MKYEPPFNHAALLQFFRREYGIPAERLIFVPMGMVACSYVIECSGAPARYFARLLGAARLARINAGRLAFYLPVCESLRRLGHAVPYAIRTRSGDLVGKYEDQDVVLYPYLSGTTVWRLPERPPALTARLAEAVARLHADTPRLGLDLAACPYMERYRPHWRDTLLLGLAELSEISPRHRAGQRKLRDELLPEQGTILAMLKRMEHLGQEVQARNPPLVLVHTDLNDSNLIWEKDRLYLLDWEGAMLAPAEHDLFIFTGEHFEEFLRVYRRAVGPHTLSAEAFGFYFYRRNLEDLTDWIVTILYENTEDFQDEEDLAGIQTDCMNGWPWIEKGIQQVERLLALNP